MFREIVCNSRSGRKREHKSTKKIRVSSEPACPEAVLEGCGPSNTRRKAVLLGRSSRNTLTLLTVKHTVQVRVPAH